MRTAKHQPQPNLPPPVPGRQPLTWVLVVHARAARIFLRLGKRLQLLSTILPPPDYTEGLDNDAIGRTRTPQGRNAKMEPTMEQSRQREEDFTREVCFWIGRAADTGDFERLEIVAAPAMLGLLRAHLPKPAKKRLALAIAKDLAHGGQEQVKRALEEVLP
jgi:protein required for attachment to host cells